MEIQERPAYVEFEVRAEENRGATIEAGHPVFDDVVYAIVTPPGGNLVVEKKAAEWVESKRNDRFYRNYREALDAFLEGREAPVDGTAVELWPAASPAAVKQIRAAGLRTVEDLAAANETSISKMGMGGRALKQRAVSWLDAAGDTGKVAEENAAMRATLADLEDTVKRQAAQIEELTRDQPKRGRPKKQDAA